MTEIIKQVMLKGKGQGLLPVTILSHTARQGPAVPKISPENE